LHKGGVTSGNQNVNGALVKDLKDVFGILQGIKGMIQGRTQVQAQKTGRVNGTADMVGVGQALDAMGQEIAANQTQDDAEAMGNAIDNLK
jgi:hypothetical protein